MEQTPKVALAISSAMVGAGVVDESREVAAAMSQCWSKSMRYSEDDETAEQSGD